MTDNTSNFRLYTEIRGKNKYVYIKQTYRVKIDKNSKGKTRNTGKSKSPLEKFGLEKFGNRIGYADMGLE